jgi:hypothetical protein
MHAQTSKQPVNNDDNWQNTGNEIGIKFKILRHAEDEAGEREWRLGHIHQAVAVLRAVHHTNPLAGRAEQATKWLQGAG